MADDWRVELDVDRAGGLRRLVQSAHEHTVAREARHDLGDRVAVTLDGDRLFAYTSTEAEANEAARVLAGLAASHDLSATATVMRWHPDEERWEVPSVPLPANEAEHAAEHRALEAREEAESRAQGFAAWEVRVELADRGDTVALAERLEADGLIVVRRAHFLLIGAASEDEAHELADRIRALAPAGATVTAEGSAAEAWADLHPFAIFGGLGN